MHSLSDAQNQVISASVALSEGQRIVLLDVAGRKDLPAGEVNENIYCINAAGHIQWQIRAEPGMYSRDSFVWLERGKDGNIFAGRFFGNEYLVDPSTGAAKHVGWRK